MRHLNQNTVPRSLERFLKDPEAYTFMRNVSPFSLFDMGKIWLKFQSLALSLPNVIRLSELGPQFKNVLIVGDTHGDLDSTLRLTRPFLQGKVDALVFMGDYVDRGKFSFLNLMYILGLCLAWPDRVIILRGNHEDMALNLIFGFNEELQQYFENPDVFKAIQAIIVALYDLMSLAAVSPLESLCIHAGIPKVAYPLGTLNLLPKPHSNFNALSDIQLKGELKEIFTQIRWNDPTEKELEHPNARSYHGFYFYTEPELDAFLKMNNLQRIYRSHEHPRGVFQEIFPNRLYYVFSSTSKYGTITTGHVIHEKGEHIYLRDIDFNLKKKIK
ncbi:MAG: hypothetical protein DRO88_10480 [Promethearchaeia archaeon]|nr:MAG: hypothetical protein DRO88_10480 [Candidatus Lokiarchaeia archaeon]